MISLFCGEDSYDSYLKARNLAVNLSSDTGFQINVVDADEVGNPNDFLQEVEGIDMFSSGHIILAKRLLKNKKLVDLLNDKFESLSKNDIVIWEDGKADQRLSLVKKLKTSKSYFESPALKEWELKKWLTNECKIYSFSLSGSQQSFLLEHIGIDKWTLKNEIEKIAIYLQSKSKKSLSQEEMNILLGYDVKGDMWKFLDNVGNKKIDLALIELDKLMKYESLGQYVIVMLAREFNNIAKILYCIDKKKDLSDAKLHPFVLKKTIEKAKNFTFGEVANLMKELVDLDISIKQGETEENIGLVLFLNKMR